MLLIVLIVLLLFIIFIVKDIRENYLESDPFLLKIRKELDIFFDTEESWEYPIDSDKAKNVMKNIKIYKGEKSYTINKRKVYLCMKNEKGNYYSKNTLIYVLAHEISHVLCDEIGHTEKFHEIFEILLNKMIERRLYNPSLPPEENYCAYNSK